MNAQPSATAAAPVMPTGEVDLRAVVAAVRTLRWRIRLQRVVRAVVGGLAVTACAAFVGALLHALWVMPPSLWEVLLLGSAAVTAVAAVVALLWRIDALRTAAALDRASDLKDRLGTALSLMASGGAKTEFQAAQLRDAARHAPSARPSLAAPWRIPREVALVVVFIAAAWGVTWLQLDAPEQASAALRPWLIEGPTGSVAGLPAALPPDPERDLPGTSEQHEAVKEQLEAIKDKVAAEQKEVKPADDAEGAKTLAELQALVDDIQHERVSDREATKKLAELDEQLDAMDTETPEQQAEASAREDAVEEAAKALDEALDKTKLATPEIKEELEKLAKELEDKKLEEASDTMKALMEKFMKLPPKDQARLAEMFKDLAKKFENPLKQQMNALKEERDRLAKKNDEAKGGGSKKDKDRLNKLDRQLDQLSRNQNGTPEGQKRRELDKLSRDMKDLADKLRRDQKKEQQDKQEAQNQPENEQKRPKPADQPSMQELKKMLEKMQQRTSKQRTGQKTRMKMADVKELMKQRKGMGQGERMELEKLARGDKGGDKPGSGTGERPGDKPGERPGNKPPAPGAEWQRMKDGLESQWRELAPKDSQGAAKAAMLGGPETDMEAKMEDDQLTGQKGAGESNRLVLKGAAAKGTGVKGYGELQIDYSSRAARQMQDEAVPPGYREYVEEYFRLIRER